MATKISSKKPHDESSDLTRIEDLSEFVHQEDSDLDSVFSNFSTTDEGATEAHTDVLEDVTFESNSEDEVADGTSFEELPMTDLGYLEEENEALPTEEIFESLPEISVKNRPATEFEKEHTEITQPEEVEEETIPEVEIEEVYNYEPPTPIYANTTEKFEDVKAFAQNFSYGKVSMGGGNPPYTLIARQIKFQDDAESIMIILEELGLVDQNTQKDIQTMLEMGSLIIPQISEYTAIVLAHKLRRFDLDLEVGLSDEIHPSKSGETNPRGLLKKESLRQNRSETLKLKDLDISIQDIIVSTTPSIPGYFVESYLGVQTTFSIVEESELEKLQYVDSALRDESELLEYHTDELSSNKAFKDYKNSFILLYEDLSMQLKQKAYAQKANALLGLSFQLSPMQFERSHKRVNAYQITCSATLAVVGRESN
jgi:uncharacterized protein YbjQ (UPF0145 family)